MKTTCYLTFNRRGVDRVTKSLPGLNSGEFAVRLRLEVPDEFFAPEVPTVDLTINARDAIVPVVVVDGVQETEGQPNQNQIPTVRHTVPESPAPERT